MDQETLKLFIERMKEFSEEGRKAVAIFDDAPRYDEAELIRLAKIQEAYGLCGDAEQRAALRAEFAALRDSMKPRKDAGERIILWPKGKMPAKTQYTDNSDRRLIMTRILSRTCLKCRYLTM